MTEIIFPRVLKLFIIGFSIRFGTESDICENRSYGQQTWSWTKHEVGGHYGGPAGPRGRPGGLPQSPFRSIFGRRGPWFITSWISWFSQSDLVLLLRCASPILVPIFLYAQHVETKYIYKSNREQIVITKFIDRALYYMVQPKHKLSTG